MSEQQQLEARLQETATAPRVTLQQIEQLLAKVTYVDEQPAGTTSTFCHAYLPGTDGRQFYLASGHSACVSPANFNADIGRELARKQAVAMATGKLWELEGYVLFKALTGPFDVALEAQANAVLGFAGAMIETGMATDAAAVNKAAQSIAADFRNRSGGE